MELLNDSRPAPEPPLVGQDIGRVTWRTADVRDVEVGQVRRSAGRGFVVRDLPWTEEKLRALPPFEFENWAAGGRAAAWSGHVRPQAVS